MKRTFLVLLLIVLSAASAVSARAGDAPPGTGEAARPFGVGPQYDTSHVYVAPADLERFVASFVATFGGKATAQSTTTVTPTPSTTLLQAALAPVGLVSAFGFTSPVPYPFGSERTGYLVTDLDAAVRAARDDGASIVVAPFDDPIGRDAVVEWPGGVRMQFYRHTVQTQSPALETVPENRVYVPSDAADAFVSDFSRFAAATLVSDDAHAPGIEVGDPAGTYRRIRLESLFGKLTVLATDGHLAYPYGRETTGYEVADLSGTLAKARAAGAAVLVPPYTSEGREAAFVAFPGGYVAEIHSRVK
jgi:hypothetical protein